MKLKNTIINLYETKLSHKVINQFKVGDVVECVNDDFLLGLIKGNKYIVKHVGGSRMLILEGVIVALAARFKKVD